MAARSEANSRHKQGATRRHSTAPQRRQPSRWLGRTFIVAGTLLVVAIATRGYLELVERPVARITVTGSLEHTRAQVVKDTVQPALAGGFLRADLGQMRAQLEGLPWIFEANVRRRWPDTIEINVEEQNAIARWGDDGFLNHVGDVFHSPTAQDVGAMPLLLGPQGTARELMATYRRLVELLAPLSLTVDRLVLDEYGELVATLAGGVQLYFGERQFLERVHRFALLYEVNLAARFSEVRRVDLRYTSGAAVAFDETSQVAGL